MKLKNRLFLLSLVAVLTLLVNLAFPITAFADDETPPPAATEEPALPPTEAPTEQAAPQKEPTVAEVLEQLPLDTELVVINQEGEVLPLTTQEAAEIIVTGDPVWCPASLVGGPTPGANGCTTSYTSLQSLLTDLDTTEKTEPGIIWIESSYDSSVNDPAASGFVISGLSFTTMRNYALTLQGGWSGTSGDTSITGTSTFTGDYLQVTSWNAAVTINDLAITGTSGNKAGLEISSSGAVTLNNVSASANGAKYGSLIYGFSSLLIQNNSIFNSNGSTASGWGLFAYAPGSSLSPITLMNVQASGNSTGGAYIDTDGNATVSNSKFENNTSGYGLDASNVKGTLTLSDVTFNGNCLGDYYYGGTAVLTSGLCNRSPGGGSSSSSASIIPVTGGEPITCDGSTTSVTVMLPNGDFVILACPINEYAVVNQTPEAGLPVPLEDDLDFISAMTALVIRANQPVESLEDPMLVSFIIPNGMEDAGFAIRFWDGTEWVEVDGQLSNDGLYFEATTNLTGTFVFVKK